ncbi:MAG: hypothetical protein ACRETC_05905 [Gammaproteobacteria bacterium]
MSNRKLAVLILLPALAVFSTSALALGHGGQSDNNRHDRQSQNHSDRHIDRNALRERAGNSNPRQDQHLAVHSGPSRGHNPSSGGYGSASPGRGHDSGGDRHGGGGYHGGGGGYHGGDHDGGSHQHGGHGHYHGGWHGQRSQWHGQTYWRFNIRLFPRYDYSVWRGGYWHHGWHGGRWGWWWLAGGGWYYYSAPIYPYPNPYVPGNVVVVNNPPPAPVAPTQAPIQYWYHCAAPDGYYPYVPECPGGWTKVPATPPGVTAQPTMSPPQATR